MIKEKDLVPCITSDLPYGDWIIFAPHHDDETIGMGGSLVLAQEKGIKVTLVIVTDGSHGGDRGTREKETHKVAKRLGIKEVIFLRESDRNIIINENLVNSVMLIIDKSNANSVFFPSPMELHPDHRMTTELVWNALGKTNIKVNAYAYEITVQNQVNYIIDISNVMDKKKSLLKIYQSQLKKNDYMDFMVSMNRLRAYTLGKEVIYAEGFYDYGNNYTEDYHEQLDEKLKPYLKKEYIDKNISLNVKKYNSDNISKDLLKTLVSVIIPCFNDGQYLHEALYSVINQTYENIEIIIVNDASTDKKTIDILNELQSYGLKVINLKANLGPGTARNKGIKIAQGKYILPLDSDDKIASTYIEKAINILESNKNIGIVYCEAEYFGLKTGKWTLPKYSFPEILISNMIFATAMYRKTDWKTIGGYDENMVEGNEDYDLWISILELNREVYQINEVLFYYRVKAVSRTVTLLENENNVVNSFQQLYNNHLSLYGKNIDFVFRALRKKIQEKELLDKEREQQISGKDQLIQEREQQITGKDELIQEQEHQLQDKEQQIASKDQLIKEREQQLQEKEQLIEEKDQLIKEREQQLQGKDQLIKEREQQLQGKDQFIKEKESVLDQKEQTLNSNNEEIESLKNELLLIYTGRSWKVTRFLRKFKRYFR